MAKHDYDESMEGEEGRRGGGLMKKRKEKTRTKKKNENKRD